MTHRYTLNFMGVEIDVEYDYQPEEKMVMFYADGSGYPGCAEQFEITKVSHLGEDITDLCEVYFDKIEQAIRDNSHEDR
jgi:hypothetical protein